MTNNNIAPTSNVTAKTLEIKGLGRSLTKNNYDFSNTQSMYLGGGSGADKTQAFCVLGNCQAELDNIHGFLQEQGAHPDALAFPWPDSP